MTEGFSRARKVAMKGLMLDFSHQIFQHFLQVTIEFRLSEGRRAAEQCQVRSQTAQPRLCVSQGQL